MCLLGGAGLKWRATSQQTSACVFGYRNHLNWSDVCLAFFFLNLCGILPPLIKLLNCWLLCGAFWHLGSLRAETVSVFTFLFEAMICLRVRTCKPCWAPQELRWLQGGFPPFHPWRSCHLLSCRAGHSNPYRSGFQKLLSLLFLDSGKKICKTFLPTSPLHNSPAWKALTCHLSQNGKSWGTVKRIR